MENFFLLLKADEVKVILEGAIGNSHIDLVRVLSGNESSYLRDFCFILDNWHTRYESFCCKHYRVCPSKWLNNKGNFLARMIENSRLGFRYLTNFSRTHFSPHCLSAPFSLHSWTGSLHTVAKWLQQLQLDSCNFKSNGTWFLSQKFQCV